MLKVGLIGVGGISGAHIPAWLNLEGVELVALCDIRPEQMEKYPDIKHYTDFDEMLANEKLDILDICLPTYLHADYSIKAMEKGINVLCEKPISLKCEDVKRVYDAAEKNNVKLMVAHVIRFWREYEYVKAVFDSGKYGKLLSGNMKRLSAFPAWSWDNWMRDEKRSGFVPYDLHIHDLDFLVYAFGEPKDIKSYRSKMPDQDYINVTYDFGDFFVNAESSWYASPYPFTAQFRFQFEDAIISNEGQGLKIYERGGNVLDLAQAESGDTGAINLPKSGAYAEEIVYFANCVKANKATSKVKPEELETVIDILNSL
ncbi:MAG: Gfo/Idh/MocA family oxidoreductase [Clostridia bacterium]|nr:Gfo/Idh/MocA family oxidoreductase [Clostridia bacterium]